MRCGLSIAPFEFYYSLASISSKKTSSLQNYHSSLQDLVLDLSRALFHLRHKYKKVELLLDSRSDVLKDNPAQPGAGK